MLVETNLVEQCMMMLVWVSTIPFCPRNLLTYSASKIVNIGISELYLIYKWDRISPGMQWQHPYIASDYVVQYSTVDIVFNRLNSFK